MPAQHGSSTVLERMGRGYTCAAYRALIERSREIIGLGDPARLGLSSDFISGFCGETEEDHRELICLIRDVGFDQAFTYSYSERDQTLAGKFYDDDVSKETKKRRLTEVIDAFQTTSKSRNSLLEIGRLHTVLVEGPAKLKASSGDDEERGLHWTGRTDTNKRVVFRDTPVLAANRLKKEHVTMLLADAQVSAFDISSDHRHDTRSEASSHVEKGDFVVVRVTECRGHTLKAEALALTSITESHVLGI